MTGTVPREGNSKYKTQAGTVEQGDGAGDIWGNYADNLLTTVATTDHGIMVRDDRGGKHGN